MPVYVSAFLIGVIAGLRSFTAPAAVSWAARLGWIHLQGTRLDLGASITPWVLSLLAAAELVGDKLPKTPSRKAPPSFAFRIFTGAVSGAALGLSAGVMTAGLIAGAIGAVAGTLGGYTARAGAARAFGRDLPAALLEDVVAVGGAVCITAVAR